MPSLDDLLQAHYSDETLRAAVKADIALHGTEKHIVKGRLRLPHPNDAARWLAKKVQDAQPKTEDDD